VKAGTGIGGAIVAGGRLQRGALGGAGELGHLSVDDGASVRCRCGNYGCLEALAGGAAVVEQLRARGHDLRDVRDVPALVRAGVPDAVSAVRDAGRLLGTALASAVTLLNPSVVVVGGALSGCGEHLLVGVREVVYKHSMVLHLRELRVEVGRLGDQAGVIGASVNALDDVLSAHAIDGTDERPKLSTTPS
jgi:predicted NBD/HSP70 family sugar kinase